MVQVWPGCLLCALFWECPTRRMPQRWSVTCCRDLWAGNSSEWLNIFRLFPFAVIYIWGVTLCSRISWLLYSHAVKASGSRKTTEQHTLVVNDNRYVIDSAMKRAAVQGCRAACRGTITVGMLLHSSYIKKVILISSCCRATLWLSLAEETRMHHSDFLVE